jgi:hypothetical protein
MKPNPQTQIHLAIKEIVSPIVEFLLETGIGFREFSQIAKAEFVRLASKAYGVRGRPTNISRLAVITGLTRKEIRAIRDSSLEFGPASIADMERVNPGTVVLHAWYSDPDFIGPRGEPLALAVSGEKASFGALCRRYAGDIPSGAMLAELKRAGSVRENSNGQVIPVSRYYTPSQFDGRFVGSMAFSLSNLARTLATNATYSSRGDAKGLQESGLMERYVWTTRLSKKDAREFKLLAEKKSADLLAELDAWIGERENGPKEDDSMATPEQQSKRGGQDLVGLGVYLFEKDAD